MKNVIITGAANGVGRAVVQLLENENLEEVLVYSEE